MVKHVTFVAGSQRTLNSLVRQLKEYIPADIDVAGIFFHEGINAPVSGELVIFSSKEAYDDLAALGLLGKIEQSFICNRTINYENIEEVVNLPQNTRVLFVNDKEETVAICIADMLEMGLNHIQYVPYHPGMAVKPSLEGIQVAITPGEADKVPGGIPRTIDLGARVIDILSLYKIMELLGLGELQVDMTLKKYLKKIIHVARKAADYDEELETLKRNLRHEARIRGYAGHYRFEDIVGSGEQICRAKERAVKLAATDLTILIEGESGTGKELFASAIHNASRRRDRAFVAVNFSALPEELVESELFGYVEGAFTGAKKGGKAGLFELADGGTIFLDEIGDVSPRVQTKLLRVLQEREILSVGDTKIKKVDIRIIAATNKNLAELVERQGFRSDLYYRLKVGQIFLPPLRERKEDIRELIDFFLKKEVPGQALSMDPAVVRVFLEYDWKGNIRELESIIRYMAAVRSSDFMGLSDLPDLHFLESARQTDFDHPLSQAEERVLRAAVELTAQGCSAGRGSIAARLQQQPQPLTPGQVRRILACLEDKGYLRTRRGSQGLELNPKALAWAKAD